MASASPNAAAAWDQAAAGWDRNTSLIRAWLAEANEAMLDTAGIGPGKRVLDVAAGAGDQTIDIARRVGPSGEVLATDIAPRMVALAVEKLRREELPWAGVCVADAQALGLDDAAFDAAICRLGLMFCIEPLDALRGIYRALAPGGRFAALVFSHRDANPCIAIMNRIARLHAGLPADVSPPPGSLLSLGRPGLLGEMLGTAGFREVTVRPMAAPLCLSSCAEYLDFVGSAGSPIMDLLRPLSKEQQQQAWDEIAGELDQFSTAGGWEGPNELLLCAGAR